MPNVSVVFLTKVSRIYFSGFCRFFKWRSSQIPEHLNDCAYLHLWLTLCSQHLALKGIWLKFITWVKREGECQAFWAWSGVSKCQGRNAQVCAEGSHGPLSSQVLPSQAQLTGWTALSAGTGGPGSACRPHALTALHSLCPSFLGWTKVELTGPFPSKDWPLITTGGQIIKTSEV